MLLRDSPIRVLILNGKSVVLGFEGVTGTSLNSKKMPSWSLPRKSSSGVMGVAYEGVVTSINGINLGHNMLVLGFNHNLQSSFGVTRQVIQAIHQWVAESTRKV